MGNEIQLIYENYKSVENFNNGFKVTAEILQLAYDELAAGSGGGVESLNGLEGALTIQEGNGMAVSAAGDLITIAVDPGNGLEIVGDKVGLGGNLSQTTNINLGANNMFINFTGGSEVKFQNVGQQLFEAYIEGATGAYALLDVYDNGNPGIIIDVENDTFDDYVYIEARPSILEFFFGAGTNWEVYMDGGDIYFDLAAAGNFTIDLGASATLTITGVDNNQSATKLLGLDGSNNLVYVNNTLTGPQWVTIGSLADQNNATTSLVPSTDFQIPVPANTSVAFEYFLTFHFTSGGRNFQYLMNSGGLGSPAGSNEYNAIVEVQIINSGNVTGTTYRIPGGFGLENFININPGDVGASFDVRIKGQLDNNTGGAITITFSFANLSYTTGVASLLHNSYCKYAYLATLTP